MAMRMSIASGLHRKTLAVTLDPRITEVRNRLWWSVYSIDKSVISFLALKLHNLMLS
jgi:hypothetical protein